MVADFFVKKIFEIEFTLQRKEGQFVSSNPHVIVYNSVSQTMGSDPNVGRQDYANGSPGLVNYRT